VLDRLAATYPILFLAMTDLGIVQNPMFGTPHGGAVVLPGYGPGRVMVDGAFSTFFRAGGNLLLSLAWIGLFGGAVFVVSRRAVGASTSGSVANAAWVDRELYAEVAPDPRRRTATAVTTPDRANPVR
jgi:hypothetical protein